MDIFQAMALGLVQGVTEWLPISSSGHLVLLQSAFGISPPVFFDILLHLGTLLAVILYFRNDIMRLAKLTMKGEFSGEGKVVPYLVLALILSGIVAFFIKGQAESMFSNAKAVGYAFLAMGCVLLATKFIGKEQKTTLKAPILIGLAQGVAAIPGISRSGSTMAAGMFAGMKREEAARFSFLLSIPAIIGATIIEWEPLALTPEALIGAVLALAAGYATIDALLKVVRKKKFYLFGFYCFAVGLIALTFL